MEIKGKLIQLLPLQTGQGKNGTWRKQDCIIETYGQFPKKVCFSIWGDKIPESLLQIGSDITVQFDVESREYNGRWYTELRAWKVEGSSQQQMPNDMPPPPPITEDFLTPQAGDDLPF